MNSTKRLSVIIPGYNTREEWWRRCLMSVRNACGPEDEIICVDDGSDVVVDASWIFADTDDRVKLTRQSNGGLSRARNAALAMAKGKYVAFVDSDDEVCSGVFDKCIKALSKFCADVAIYGVRVIWPNDGLMKDDMVSMDECLGCIQPKDVKRLSDGCLLNYACNKIYRVEFLKNNCLVFQPDGMPFEDIIFNLSCIMAGAKFFVVADIGYIYYRTHGTLLSRYNSTSYSGRRMSDALWKKYKDSLSGSRAVLGELGETSRFEEDVLEWRNIWMPGAPYSIWRKWLWLREHHELGGLLTFIKMFAWSFLRRHLYVKPIRRWHIRRLYPYARNWER